MERSGFRRLRPALQAVVLFSCLAYAASAGQQNPDPLGYRFIVIGGQQIAWPAPRTGAVLEISYALVDRPVERPGARNCPSLVSMEAAGVSSGAALADIEKAMSAWQAGTNVRFVPAENTASADLVIGMQGKATGIAYTDLELQPDPGSTSRMLVSGAAVCFNPQLAWEIGTIDGDPATPNLRYVTLHELGHVLGLDHVLDQDTLMTFRNLEHLDAPHPADFAGVQALYGQPQIDVAVE